MFRIIGFILLNLFVIGNVSATPEQSKTQSTWNLSSAKFDEICLARPDIAFALSLPDNSFNKILFSSKYVFELTTCVAPSFFANSSLSSNISTARCF